MGQYMLRSHRAGRPFLRTFFQGGPDLGTRQDKDPGCEQCCSFYEVTV